MTIDIRLDVEFFQHPKTIKLERRLGFEGVKALLQLWMWAAKNRPDGLLSNMDDEDIEIAAGWMKTDPIVPVLIDLRWIDRTDEGYVLHNWGQRNPWVATTTDRGDRARFSRMASTHPAIYARLMQEGRSSISRAEYVDLTTGQGANASTTPDIALDNETSTPVNAPLTPDPSPSPSPSIKEDPSREGEISTGYPPNHTHQDRAAMEMLAQKALAIYRMFSGYKPRKTSEELSWIVSLYQNHQIDIGKCFQEAYEWANTKGLHIKNPRAFLTDWIKRVQEERT